MKSIQILLILLSLNILSQTDSLKTYTLDPIVVTGTRIETLRKHIPLTISVISNDDIKNANEPQVFSLIAARVPGLFVTERSNLGYGLAQGSAGQVTIRGIGSNPNTQVLILLDGRPQFMGLFGHPLPDNYITTNAERVEVVRGPCSFLYGTNAMGGVINIISKRQKDNGYSVNIRQSYGTFSTLIGDAGVGYKMNRFDAYATVSRQQSNGDRPSSEFSLNNGFIKTGYRINDQFAITLDGNITQFRTLDPGTLTSPKVNNWVDILRASGGFTVENKNAVNEGALKLLFNYGEHKIYDGFHSKDRNIALSLYQTLSKIKNLKLSLGFDFKHYGGEAENTNSGYSFGRHFINETGGYIHAQYLGAGRISINAGFRIEQNNVTGTELIPQLGVSYQVLKKNLSVRANFSKGFRSPTIRELYLFPAPTPGLKAERMWSYEAGVQFHYKNILSIEPVFFYEEGSNIIQPEGVYPNLRLANSGRFIIKGWEVSAYIKPADYFNLNMAFSFTKPGNLTQSNPQTRFFAEGRFAYGIAAFNTSFEHNGKLYGANNSMKKLPDYSLMNLSLSVSPFEHLSVFCSAENVFNRKYEIVYGYPLPGRTYKAGFKFN
jgi:iron complex outermembrane receptor protein